MCPLPGVHARADIVAHETGELTVRDRTESDTAQITLATIAEAITDLRDETVRINTDVRATILAAWEANSAVDIDAETADVLVQLSGFGTITYG